MNMKKLKLAFFTCSTAAMLAACSTPAPTTVIGFNYEIDNAKANGIVQVFDLSGNTVVQIRDINPKTTHFLDLKNVAIPFKVIGENVVLAGTHASFTVSTSTAASLVIRKPTAPTALPAHVAVIATAPAAAKQTNAADSDAAILAEIMRMRVELAELRKVIAAGATRDVAPSTPAIANASQLNTAEPSVVIVPFPNNSHQFNPANDQRARLLALSQSAKSISVRGFTDSEFPTAGSEALAKARAEAAKRYLVSKGVAAAKIVVGFNSAGKFVAENRSPAGRAANRRVEIEGT
jgi:outer membrane protein OmpA-like peptidoglycan-associated protein